MRCSLLDYGLYFYPEEDNLALNKACCTFASGHLGRNNTHSLERISLSNLSDIFQDNHRIEAIKSLEKDEHFTSCNSCWKHEKVGYPSMRTRVNSVGMSGEIGQLKYLELNTGNTCNIQCVMCNPSDSLKTKMYIPIREKYDQKNLGKKWDSLYARGLRRTDIDELDFEIFKNLEYLKSTGGETFYSKEYWYMLEKFISKGYAKNITIINVTNNTIPLDDNKLDIFKQFKKVKIFSSVDGIGDLCESVRAGSKWKDVQENIKHLIELSNQYPDIFVHTEPHSVVQFANALQLDEIVNWWESVAMDDYKDKQYFRILDDPKYYDIKNLDQSIKDSIIKKYEKYNKLNHVVKYLETTTCEIDQNIGLSIFEESCKINNTKADSSEIYRIIKHGI